MRTFTLLSTDPHHTVPELGFIMAQDERRAAELAGREFLDAPDTVAIELVENGRTIGVLKREDALRTVGTRPRSRRARSVGLAGGATPDSGPQARGRSARGKARPQTLEVHALLLGERVNTAGLERDAVIATIPLSFRVAGQGMAALFRYGAAVFVDVEPDQQAELLRSLSSRVSAPERTPDEEVATIIVRPDQDEQITPGGAIQLRDADPQHLLIVADVLAKSVALSRDERRVAGVFDAIEPFAIALAAKGRPPGARRRNILRLIGEALLVQHRVSGRVAVREKPDILWDRPDLERLYGRLEDEYELIERTEMLDRKLAVIASSTTAFVDLQDAARSLRLEVIVVGLILAELVVAAFQLFGPALR